MDKPYGSGAVKTEDVSLAASRGTLSKR